MKPSVGLMLVWLPSAKRSLTVVTSGTHLSFPDPGPASAGECERRIVSERAAAARLVGGVLAFAPADVHASAAVRGWAGGEGGGRAGRRRAVQELLGATGCGWRPRITGCRVHRCDSDHAAVGVVGEELGGEFGACDLGGVDVLGERYRFVSAGWRGTRPFGDVVAGEAFDERELVGAAAEHRAGAEGAVCE
jgi:hypothetical protein